MAGSPDIQAGLHEAKVCTKCKKKVEKIMKKKGMSGGSFADNAGSVQSGGTCGGTCTAAMSGGSCGGTCCMGGV